eukprot:2981466-Pyramimonas_sp.AAC.2
MAGGNAPDFMYNKNVPTNTGSFDKKLSKTSVWNDDIEVRNKVIRPQMRVRYAHNVHITACATCPLSSKFEYNYGLN